MGLVETALRNSYYSSKNVSLALNRLDTRNPITATERTGRDWPTTMEQLFVVCVCVCRLDDGEEEGRSGRIPTCQTERISFEVFKRISFSFFFL